MPRPYSSELRQRATALVEAGQFHRAVAAPAQHRQSDGDPVGEG